MGAPWRDVPERFVKWNSIYTRFNRWALDGTWERLLAEAQKQADVARKIDWVVSIDSTLARGSARRDPRPGVAQLSCSVATSEVPHDR